MKQFKMRCTGERQMVYRFDQFTVWVTPTYRKLMPRWRRRG